MPNVREENINLSKCTLEEELKQRHHTPDLQVCASLSAPEGTGNKLRNKTEV